jgi:Flp pilus assembly protein TadG
MADRPPTDPTRRSRFLARLCSGSGRAGQESGQALVEFALIVPIMLIMLMALIEFSLAFNADLGINRASQDAVAVASVAGNTAGSDCMILNSIENDVQAPNDKSRIVEVEIQWTTPTGNTIKAYQQYSRSGSTTCDTGLGTLTVPYTATVTGYPIAQRCNVVAGCLGLTATHTTVDTVAVKIRYTYIYQTPMGSLLKLISPATSTPTSWTFTKRNLSRLEPTL